MTLFTREPRIEASLLERRDDVREWAVYADWLEANGSPRGALASLMLRREVTSTLSMTEALKAHAELISELTPEPFKTLATRGAPRLAPVFRRGFIVAAGALDDADFSALVEHPSCALLDEVILQAGDFETLTRWLAGVKAPLPWRRVELNLTAQDDEIVLGRLFALTPRLRHLTLALDDPPETIDLKGLDCESVTFGGASRGMLRALMGCGAKKLERLEVRTRRNQYAQREENDLDELIEALVPAWKKLDELVLEGNIGDLTRRACTGAVRPARVLVRTTLPTAEPFAVRRPEEPETSFALFNRELTAEDEKAITQYAKLAGVTRLIAYLRRFTLGPRTLTLLRLHGTGEAPLVARVVAQHLVKSDRALDAIALTVSSSNDITSAWSFGPHVAKADMPKKSIPVARREEGRFTRHQMVRELLDAMVGFDPGFDVFDALEDAFDSATVRALLGDAPAAGEEVPLFTDFSAEPEPDPDEDEELDEDDDYDEYEDLGGADRRDALAHTVGEEDRGDPRWRFYEDEDNEWGAAPENVPDSGPPANAPSEQLKIEVPVVIGASLKPTANALDDDPEDDLDAPTLDAWSATHNEEEVWSEGPVDLPDHHRVPIGETFEETDGELPLGTYVPDAVPCAHCSQLRETMRCSVCRDEVCCECAGVKSLVAWDDGRDFACAQCTPRTSGRFVAVRPRRTPSG